MRAQKLSPAVDALDLERDMSPRIPNKDLGTYKPTQGPRSRRGLMEQGPTPETPDNDLRALMSRASTRAWSSSGGNGWLSFTDVTPKGVR